MKIKKLVDQITHQHGTRDPFRLAQSMNVIVQHLPLGSTLGFTVTYKRIPVIVINDTITDGLASFVCAHELGHILLHKNINTPWLKRHTFYSIDKYEREANTFAVELLLSDEHIEDFQQINFSNLATAMGIPSHLADLKIRPKI